MTAADEPTVPDEAVEAATDAWNAAWEVTEHGVWDACMRAALAAAAPHLTADAVAAERAKVRAVLDRAKVTVEDWSDIGEEPTITVGDHSYVDRQFFDDLLAAIDDPRIARAGGQP